MLQTVVKGSLFELEAHVRNQLCIVLPVDSIWHQFAWGREASLRGQGKDRIAPASCQFQNQRFLGHREDLDSFNQIPFYIWENLQLGEVVCPKRHSHGGTAEEESPTTNGQGPFESPKAVSSPYCCPSWRYFYSVITKRGRRSFQDPLLNRSLLFSRSASELNC